MESISTNGIRYAVATWGDRSTSAVILLHGWMGTSHSWRKVAPLLADSHFVIAPDMRGYGRSDKPDAGYDAESLANDIAGVLNAYEIPRAHVVGHDMGALAALVFAGKHSDRALSLTYLDEPLVGYNLDSFTAYREETFGGYWHFGFNTAPGLAELLLEGREQAFVDFLVPLMHAPNPAAVSAEDRRVYASSLEAPNGIAGSVGWYRATFETARQIRSLGESGLPVPVMAWGGEYGVPQTNEQFELIGVDARGGVLEGVGHLIPEEAPERLASELAEFFLLTESAV